MNRRLLAAGVALAGAGGLIVSGCANAEKTGLAPGFGFGIDAEDGGFPIPPSGEPGLQPEFAPTQTQAAMPPPLSGGTLIVAHDGRTAVAADPDRDQVYLVDLETEAVTTIALQPGDEPGRLIEDGSRRVHIAARGSGAVITVDLLQGTVVGRRDACRAPRGVAYDSSNDSVYVACATGELVTFPASGGAATRTVTVERDLRDVVVSGGKLYVSTFRKPQLLALGADGSILSRQTPPSLPESSPDVAWRLIPMPDGTLVMSHQLARLQAVSTQQGGYGGGSGCSGIVTSTVTSFTVGSSAQANTFVPISNVVLPVDVASSPDGQWLAIIGAGNANTPSLPQVFFVRSSPSTSSFPASCNGAVEADAIPAQATAVAFDGNGRAVVQTREPARLYVSGSNESNGALGTVWFPQSIPLSAVSREDTGYSIFHSNAGGQIACASCHPEGLDDGHVWTFDSGARRTQSLRGTLAGTAPYHWSGDMKDIPQLTHEVFVKRMAGPSLATDQVEALQRWLFALPAPPAPTPADAAAVARGQVLFDDSNVGCSGCHSGPKLTNNATVDVGTGGAFQVPSLFGLAWRPPFLHAGCATNLADRFTAYCSAGGSHGKTSQLTYSQLNDLLAYLETL
jgi:mono/diheme cytochrome c family protein